MNRLDRQRIRLSHRASQRFAWHWSMQQIAGQARGIATASDPDGMLVDACKRQDAGEAGVIDPFWATTWRAADGLGRFLEAYRLKDQRILELGCGTGRAGLAAALRGARVTLTDGVSDPLLLVRLSVAGIEPECHVRRLRFGVDRLKEPKFPIIIGSDVTYLRNLWPELEQCIRDHLADDGEVLLSDPHRLIANEFRTWIIARQWEYEESSIPLMDGNLHPIRIMRLRRL